MRLKRRAITLFYAGKSRHKITSYLKISRTSVDKLISRYLSHGLPGVAEKNTPANRSAELE
jgi:transposase